MTAHLGLPKVFEGKMHAKRGRTYDRKYALHFVSNDIYCSSTGHYGAQVWLETSIGIGKRMYDFDGGFWKRGAYRPAHLPKYIVNEVENRIREMYKAGELKFHEHNQDGVWRYDDLRYHTTEQFEWTIGLRTPTIAGTCAACGEPANTGAECDRRDCPGVQ